MLSLDDCVLLKTGFKNYLAGIDFRFDLFKRNIGIRSGKENDSDSRRHCFDFHAVSGNLIFIFDDMLSFDFSENIRGGHFCQIAGKDVALCVIQINSDSGSSFPL